MTEEDLVCPECGGPIGTTSTYCMHCSTDLTDDSGATAATDDGGTAGDDGVWMATGEELPEYEDNRWIDDAGEARATSEALPPELRATGSGMEGGRLYPEGFLLNALSVVFALVVGVSLGVGTSIALSASLGSGFALAVGFVVWLGATVSLSRWSPR